MWKFNAAQHSRAVFVFGPDNGRNFDKDVNVIASVRHQACTRIRKAVLDYGCTANFVSTMEVPMTKWILAAGLVAFATAAQAQYYGGGSSYSGSTYDNSSSYNSYSNGYTTSQTYGGNNDPSPSYYSTPTYPHTYQNYYSYHPHYRSGYSNYSGSGY